MLKSAVPPSPEKKPDPEPLPECPFKQGDVVQLNSGGPKMTVFATDWSFDRWMISVYHFDAAETLVRQNLPQFCLRKVDSRAK